MRSFREDVMGLALLAAVAMPGACTAPPRPGAPAGEAGSGAGECAQGFVEITPAAGACGFTLAAAGGLLHEGRTIVDPLVVSYRQDASGSRAIAAGKLVLFPASPSGRFRILQACESGANGLCWKVFVFDRETARLSEAAAGKYGPVRWLAWSPDERHVALASRSEGASWIHVVETESGRSIAFPGNASNENWAIEPETLAWTGPRSFTVMAARCAGCAAAREEVRF